MLYISYKLSVRDSKIQHDREGVERERGRERADGPCKTHARHKYPYRDRNVNLSLMDRNFQFNDRPVFC